MSWSQVSISGVGEVYAGSPRKTAAARGFSRPAARAWGRVVRPLRLPQCGEHEANRYARAPIAHREVILDRVELAAREMSRDDVAIAWRPALDHLWPTGGWERSYSFDGQAYNPR